MTPAARFRHAVGLVAFWCALGSLSFVGWWALVQPDQDHHTAHTAGGHHADK